MKDNLYNMIMKMTAAFAAALCIAFTASAETDPFEETEKEAAQLARAPLALDASPLAKAYADAGISSYKCKSALKEFEKAVEDANAAAVAHRGKISEMARTYLENCLAKAQEAGDLDKAIAFKKALENPEGELAGDTEEIVKLRNGRVAQLEKIDRGLVAAGMTAANTLRAIMDWQKKEATRKGEFDEAKRMADFEKNVEDWAKNAANTAASKWDKASGGAGGSPDSHKTAEGGNNTPVARSAPPQREAGGPPALRQPSPTHGQFGATRNQAMRQRLLALGGGNEKTETAVLRALRWLKSVQNPDGSWPQQKTAMTGFALLTFLAHGEKPGDSAEFGECVQRGLDFLISHQGDNGLFTIKDGNNYSHGIAVYALCEAYGITQDPTVKAAADKGLSVIINGQHPTGGWDYNLRQSERDDTSFMGWCAQALKAAMMANSYHDPKALERASALCVKGFKKNGFKDGGFGYTGPQKGGLTGVGALCLQFHGAAGDPYVRNSLNNVIYKWNPEWAGYSPERAARGEMPERSANSPAGVVAGACPQYYYYYATQAVFQDGGRWKMWNDRMWPSYVAAQFITHAGEPGNTCACPMCKTGQFSGKLREPYRDENGQFQEIGHWINTDAHTDRPVMDTCLAALQLMTYYRYPRGTAR